MLLVTLPEIIPIRPFSPFGGETGTELASRVFDEILPGILFSSLYQSLAQVGQSIAVIALVLLFLQWVVKLQEGGFPGNLKVFVGPLLALILLSNGGLALTQISLTARDGTNRLSQYILSHSSKDGDIQLALRTAMKDIELYQSLELALEDCEDRLFRSPEACQQKLADQILEDPDGRSFFRRFYDSVVDRLFRGIGSSIERITTSICLIIHYCFTWILEVLLLIHFLFLPLFMGFAILPTGAQVLLTWVKNFFSIFLMKLAYVLITGVSAAAAVYSKDLITLLLLPPLLGIFGPLLAVYIGAGGLPLFAQVATSAMTYPLVRSAPRLIAGGISNIRPRRGGSSSSSALQQSLRFMPKQQRESYRTRR